MYKFDVNQFKSGAKKTITWNGLTLNGQSLKSGIYLLKFKTAKTSKTVKLIKQ